MKHLHAITALGLLSACVTPAEPYLVKPGAATNAPRVVIIQSALGPLYTAATEGFVAQSEAAISAYAVDVDESGVAAAIRKAPPQLLFALGTPALLFARRHFPEVPVLFAMVVNYRRHQLEGDNIMGIELETPALVEFSQYRLVLPELKQVLAFYTPAAQELAVAAKAALISMGINLHIVGIAGPDEIPDAYERNIANVDALWLLNDPVLMNPATVDYLQRRGIAAKRPLLASLSSKFAEGGALMSVSVDFTTLGPQAAVMAHSFLVGRGTPTTVGIQPPMGAELVVNTDVARILRLTIPDDALPFVKRFLTKH